MLPRVFITKKPNSQLENLYIDGQLINGITGYSIDKVAGLFGEITITLAADIYIVSEQEDNASVGE